MQIVRGTTPTIKITFKRTDVNYIDQGYLVLKQEGANIIEKPLADAFVGENYISFTLTQAETLSLASGTQGALMFDWMIGSTRGRSAVEKFCVSDSGMDEVIE